MKPDNIGFDKYNRVKIFDFGLARQLSGPNGHAYGRTGTVRYMAPEVLVPERISDEEIAADAEGKIFTPRERKLKQRGYDLSADVFSYSILLWQIVTLRPPYAGELANYIDPTKSPQVNGRRPQLKCVDLEPVKGLLNQCWSQTPNDRPTFIDVASTLRSIVANEEQQEQDKENKSSKKIKKSRKENKIIPSTTKSTDDGDVLPQQQHDDDDHSTTARSQVLPPTTTTYTKATTTAHSRLFGFGNRRMTDSKEVVEQNGTSSSSSPTTTTTTKKDGKQQQQQQQQSKKRRHLGMVRRSLFHR